MKVSEMIQKMTGYGSKPKEAESVETLVKLFKRQQTAKTVLMLMVLISVVIQLGFSKKPPSFTDPHVAVIKVHGAIGGDGGNDGYSVIKTLERAKRNPAVKAILLDMNSGGGSPVQAEMVYDYLQSIKGGDKPVYASIKEGCMSACYYIASSADKIYAHRSSLVGSIGVRMDLWDFSEIKERYGVGKKTLSAGKHKTILDSWNEDAMNPERVELVSQNAMMPLYENFVEDIKAARLDISEQRNPNIFQGMFYSASLAKEAGLIDEIKNYHFLIEDLKKEHDVGEAKVYEQKSKTFFETLGFPSVSINLNTPDAITVN